MHTRKPIYILVTYIKQPNINRFRELVQTTIQHLQSDQIEYIECHISDVLDVAQQVVQQGCQILLCTGATAKFLQKKLSIEVHTIRTGAFDVIQAISKLKEFKKIALLSSASNFNLSQYSDIFSLNIQQFSYDSYLAAKNQISQIKAQNFEAVIGSPVAVELALSSGLSGQLLISQHTLQEALHHALQRLEKIQQQQKQQQYLTEIFNHLQEGICFISPQKFIKFANQAMLGLLDMDHQQLRHQPIQYIFKNFNFTNDLSNKPQQHIFQFAQKKLVIHCIAIQNQHLEGWLLTAQELQTLERTSSELRKVSSHRFNCRYQFADLLTQDTHFLQQIELAKHYAQTESTILITGESGTGKELLAQSIHQYSQRKNAPFVAINCGAFPETLLESELFGYEEGAFTGARKNGKIGLIEAAHQGTLFLDEIGDLPLHLQTRFLRVLQERQIHRLGATVSREIDIRVIAATHANLEQRVQQGEFRSDLYYRLNILRVFVPSLKDRITDLSLLIQHFLAKKSLSLKNLPPFLYHAMQHYTWAGNIRELENIIERISILLALKPKLTEMQFKQHLPELFQTTNAKTVISTPLKQLKHEQEQALIQRILDENSGDLELTAQQLNISRTTLWRRMKNFKSH